MALRPWGAGLGVALHSGSPLRLCVAVAFALSSASIVDRTGYVGTASAVAWLVCLGVVVRTWRPLDKGGRRRVAAAAGLVFLHGFLMSFMWVAATRQADAREAAGWALLRMFIHVLLLALVTNTLVGRARLPYGPWLILLGSGVFLWQLLSVVGPIEADRPPFADYPYAPGLALAVVLFGLCMAAIVLLDARGGRAAAP